MIPAFWFLPLLIGLIQFKPQVQQKPVSGEEIQPCQVLMARIDVVN